MWWGAKTLTVAVAATLLVAGLAACGSGDSSSTATEVASQGQAEGESSGGDSSNGEAKNGGGDEKSSSAGDAEGSGESQGNFVPKPHDDSGGGSEQFRVKGGDNSVQEFGAEADASERDEAAAALHNFLDARASGNWAAACAYVAESIAKQLEKLATQANDLKSRDCAEVFKKLTNPAAMGELRAEASRADVGSLRIEGDQAFLIYRGAHGAVLAMSMANEGGSWKVASLSGVPLS